MKKRMGYIIFVAILVVSLGYGFAPAPRALAAAQADDHAGAASVPGQLVVGFAPSTSLGSIAARAAIAAQAVGAKVVKSDEQGVALLSVDEHRNLPALMLTLKRLQGVRYAEPNYIYKDAPINQTETSTGPVGTQAMAVAPMPLPYPNDPLLPLDFGWQYVGASIVWPNTAASKTVCVLDSGVDYTHKDLVANVIKGPDYVNNDADPMDDYGRGTAVAGIISAIRNNKEGIAGVSSGKVLAVKVIDSAGFGTGYDVNQGLRYCADHADIIDVSWSGMASQTLQDAVNYAVATKGKLIVAAAGDGATKFTTNSFPAAYAQNIQAYQAFYYGVLAVAASGSGNATAPNYSCQSPGTDYGSWITFVAPGVHVYSTTPWDKPFGMINYGAHPRYDYMYGTPMAAAYVAGTAARTWGYLPNLANLAILNRMKTSGTGVTLFNNCWDASMSAAIQANVASAMDRGGASLAVEDANTDQGVAGAKVSVYDQATGKLAGSGVIAPISVIDPDTNQVVMQFSPWIDILNLSTLNSPTYIPMVSATNYTATPQTAFVGFNGGKSDGAFTLTPGSFPAAMALLPPKTAYFTVIGQNMNNSKTPDLVIWLPDGPSNTTRYIVSKIYNNSSLGDPSIAPYGSLVEHPFARWMYSFDYYEAIVIRNRTTNTTAPWYPGTYLVGMVDMSIGQNLLDYYNTSAFVWKDGMIKARVDKGSTVCGTTNIWWLPLQIISPASGAATYNTTPTCAPAGPY